MRYAARKDSTHQAIVAALKAAGIVVLDTSRLPNGFDVLCYDPVTTRFLPLEFKSPRRVSHRKKGRELQPSQVAIRAVMPIPVVETPAQALKLFCSYGSD